MNFTRCLDLKGGPGLESAEWESERESSTYILGATVQKQSIRALSLGLDRRSSTRYTTPRTPAAQAPLLSLSTSVDGLILLKFAAHRSKHLTWLPFGFSHQWFAYSKYNNNANNPWAKAIYNIMIADVCVCCLETLLCMRDL